MVLHCSYHKKLNDFELNEFSNIHRVLDNVSPDEIYNLAAQSFVHLSFEQPLYTSDCDYMGPSRILEAMRTLYMEDEVKFYQAASSEMFPPYNPILKTLQTDLCALEVEAIKLSDRKANRISK